MRWHGTVFYLKCSTLSDAHCANNDILVSCWLWISIECRVWVVGWAALISNWNMIEVYLSIKINLYHKEVQMVFYKTLCVYIYIYIYIHIYMCVCVVEIQEVIFSLVMGFLIQKVHLVSTRLLYVLILGITSPSSYML